MNLIGLLCVVLLLPALAEAPTPTAHRGGFLRLTLILTRFIF